jgi:hypothetical protein
VSAHGATAETVVIAHPSFGVDPIETGRVYGHVGGDG